MTIPADLTKVNINGVLGTTGEVFSWGFWCEGNAPTTQAEADTWSAAIAGYLPIYCPTYVPKLMNAQDSIQSVSVYAYPDGGPNALVSSLNGSPDIDGTGTGTLPFQTAFCVSTRSAFIGRRHRGRIYLPATGVALNTDRQVPTADAQGVVDELAALLDHISTSSVLGDPVIVSQVGVGETVAITALRADTRVDIQRRRADDQVPTATVTAGV